MSNVAIQHGSGKTLGSYAVVAWTRNLILIPGVLWLSLIIIIQIAGGAAAPDSDAFPNSCPEDAQNCYRIADEPYGTTETRVFLNASSSDIREVAIAWVESQPRTTTALDDGGNEFHVVFRTKLMLFPDDLFLQVGCTDEFGYLVVHSESRLGASDLGVNEARVNDLTTYLENYDFGPFTECIPPPVA